MDIQPIQATKPSSTGQTDFSMSSSAVAATPNNKPTSDDEELAKVLAGLTSDIKKTEGATQAPKVPDISPASSPLSGQDETTPAMPPKLDIPAEFMMPTPPASSDTPAITDQETAANDQAANNLSPELESVRKEALNDLKPLVGNLDLSPEEKFDIHLLLLRSTDDTSLIAPAYEIAKSIADENKRAQALLDVIKEIDYLSNPTEPEQ